MTDNTGPSTDNDRYIKPDLFLCDTDTIWEHTTSVINRKYKLFIADPYKKYHNLKDIVFVSERTGNVPDMMPIDTTPKLLINKVITNNKPYVINIDEAIFYMRSVGTDKYKELPIPNTTDESIYIGDIVPHIKAISLYSEKVRCFIDRLSKMTSTERSVVIEYFINKEKLHLERSQDLSYLLNNKSEIWHIEYKVLDKNWNITTKEICGHIVSMTEERIPTLIIMDPITKVTNYVPPDAISDMGCYGDIRDLSEEHKETINKHLQEKADEMTEVEVDNGLNFMIGRLDKTDENMEYAMGIKIDKGHLEISLDIYEDTEHEDYEFDNLQIRIK